MFFRRAFLRFSTSNDAREVAKKLAALLPNATVQQGMGTDPTEDLNGMLTLKVLVTTIDAQLVGDGNVGSMRYEPALLPPCLTIRVLSYSNL